MALTVSEKEHFKTRLREHVNAMRDAIIAQEPNWEAKITAAAQAQVEERFDTKVLMKDLKKARAAVRAARDRVTALERALIAQVSGRKDKDIDPEAIGRERRSTYPYQDNNREFPDYPGNSQIIMQEQCARTARHLERQHPIGQQLNALNERVEAFIDMITTCGSHTQMQKVWNRICQEFDIFNPDKTVDERTPRKVNTSRKRSKSLDADTSATP